MQQYQQFPEVTKERAFDDESFLVVQGFGEQSRQNQFWTDQEADLLLDTTTRQNAAANELVREVHLGQALDSKNH